MAKTRSRKTIPQIKNDRVLHDTNNSTDSKVTKRKPSTKANRTEAAGNTDDSETTYMILEKRRVTDKKIKKLIYYVEHDKMTIKDARKKANLGSTAAYKYYGLYRDDPEHNIPKLGKDARRGKGYFTYEKIEALINSIIHDKLTIDEAAKKAGMHKKTVMNYYTKYMMDPERKIPVRVTCTNVIPKVYTQEDIKKIIDYVDNEKLTVREAAKRLNMGESSAYDYYKRYKNDPEKKIPIPRQNKCNVEGRIHATYEKVKDLIHAIVDDKLSLREAATKVELTYNTASTYYSKYLRDPNHEIPVPGFHKRRYCTSEQVKQLISYIVDDKMTASDASRKIGVAPDTGRMYYQKYLNNPNRNIPPTRKPASPTKCCSFEQVEGLIGYIVNDKMSIAKAALKVGTTRNTASKYYRRYMEDPEHKIPVPKNRGSKAPTPDQITRFLGYILDDNMGIAEAGRQAGLRPHTAYIYYKIYKEDPLNGSLKHITDDQVKQLVGYVNDDKMTVKVAAEKTNIPYEKALRIYNECKDNPDERVLNFMDLYHRNMKVIADIYKKHNHIKEEDE